MPPARCRPQVTWPNEKTREIPLGDRRSCQNIENPVLVLPPLLLLLLVVLLLRSALR